MSRFRRTIKRFLFKLHLRNTYPILMQMYDGSLIEANIIRSTAESFNIKPDISRIVNKDYQWPEDGVIRFGYYSLPPDKDKEIVHGK